LNETLKTLKTLNETLKTLNETLKTLKTALEMFHSMFFNETAAQYHTACS